MNPPDVTVLKHGSGTLQEKTKKQQKQENKTGRGTVPFMDHRQRENIHQQSQIGLIAGVPCDLTQHLETNIQYIIYLKTIGGREVDGGKVSACCDCLLLVCICVSLCVCVCE